MIGPRTESAAGGIVEAGEHPALRGDTDGPVTVRGRRGDDRGGHQFVERLGGGTIAGRKKRIGTRQPRVGYGGGDGARLKLRRERAGQLWGKLFL